MRALILIIYNVLILHITFFSIVNSVCPSDDYGSNYIEVVTTTEVPTSNFANNIQGALSIANDYYTILVHPVFTQETVNNLKKNKISSRLFLFILKIYYVIITLLLN